MAVRARLDVATPLTSSPASASTWYAPYLDTTLPPLYPVQVAADNPARQTVFGFVVDATGATCTPSWGTYYSLAQADAAPLRLSQLMATMEGEGEQPIVSFGGEANQPLADTCTSAAALQAAYSSVIDRYDLRVIDLDIEGAAQGDTAALVRDAAAIRAIQSDDAATGTTLGVWLTLPVASDGMLPVAENVVTTMLAGGVQLSGVDLMTMYFSPSPGDGAPMLAAVEQALVSAHGQLAALFADEGITLSSRAVWQHMGATVQVGQAGIADQAFTTADASGLVAFAEGKDLGRLSDWSINQDAPCGSVADPIVGGYSNTCSGVVQSPLQFSDTFAALTGTPDQAPLLATATAPTTTTTEPVATATTGPLPEP